MLNSVQQSLSNQILVLAGIEPMTPLSQVCAGVPEEREIGPVCSEIPVKPCMLYETYNASNDAGYGNNSSGPEHGINSRNSR